jgi:hypothetical protein
MLTAERFPVRRRAARKALRVAVGVFVGWAALVGAGPLLSCGSPGRKFPARPSLLEPTRAPVASAASDLEWRYHPRKAAQLEREYDLGAGKRLYVGAAGERWLLDEKIGRAKPAPMLAPETLIGALTPARAPWVFVGRSGTTYDSDSPIGAFSSSSAPLVDLVRVDSSKSAILGVSRQGKLLLSEDAGLGWHEVGPAGKQFADVLLTTPYGLALEVPERLWLSEDGGRSWRALDQPAFGARGLQRDEEVGPVAVSLLGIQAVSLAAAPVVSALGRALRPLEPALARPPMAGPSARALGRGRAFVSGGRYHELVLGAKPETLAGPFAGELDRRAAPQFAACSEARVAGFERWVYVACTRERSGAARQFEFFRSEDGGQSFEREGYVARGDPELIRLAVGQGGVLLGTGFCAPSESVAGCRAQGISKRGEPEGDAGDAPSLAPVAAPALEEHARGLVFSSDGRIAYAVGARTKSDSLFAFVSTDLTRGFVARPLVTLDGSEWRGPSEVVELVASDEGQVSLVLAQASGAQRLLVLDASARMLSLNAPPVDAATIGAYGNRALAISPDGIWESLNGGAEWESLGRLPRSICAAASGRCSIPVRCQAEGCTLGDSLSRLGWRGHEPPSSMLPAPSGRGNAAGRRSLGPAWSCELSSTEWAELRGVDQLPDASRASLGKAAWFALATDETTASAGLWIAENHRSRLDRNLTIRYSELLGPAARASDVAFHAAHQVEGAAALRYRIPTAAPGAALTDIEVAWDNLLDGQHARGVVANAGGALPGDFVKGEGVARRAQPDLLSIARGGIFARVHRQPQQDQPSYFLDGSSVQQVPALRWPFTPPKEAVLEMARIGGESVQLAFVDQGATVVRARRRHDTWQLDAMTIGYFEASSFAIEQHRFMSYARGHAGIQLTTRREDGTADGQLFLLQAEGPVLAPPLAVPTQRDLGESPRACTQRERADTPRTVAPFQPGRRRPLVVHDAVEPVRVFLTDDAVLHGTPDNPCADVFDADLVRSSSASGNARERALLSLEGPSWLFRAAPDNSRRDARVEYRSMTCRPDAAAELPPDIYDMPGTDLMER